MAEKTKSVKCVRDIRSFPPTAYRLQGDGRKWRLLCDQRQRLAWLLATYANGDGTRIRPGIQTLADALGFKSRHTIHDRLNDLEKLWLLQNGKLTGFMGTRERILNIEAFAARLSILHIWTGILLAVVQHSRPDVQDSQDRCATFAQTDVQHSHVSAEKSRESCTEPTSALPPKTTATTDPAGGGWFEKYTAVMGAAGRRQKPVLESLAANHDEQTVGRAVELLLKRGLGNATNPWAVFISTAAEWVEKAKQEKQAAIQKVKRDEQIEAYIAEQKKADWERMNATPPTGNGGSVLEYLADLEKQ